MNVTNLSIQSDVAVHWSGSGLGSVLNIIHDEALAEFPDMR